MYDQEGYPVWYFVNGEEPDNRGDIDARLLDSGNVLVGPTSLLPAVEVDLAGNVVWEGPPQVDSPSPMTHHMEKLANGNYLTLRQVLHEEREVWGTMIEELTPEHQVVWQWSILDHIEPEPDVDEDWCHGNSAAIDREADVFYMSSRNLHTVYKGRLSTGEILWRLGEDGDFDVDPPSTDAWFAELHDPELQENGNILIYDNGSVRGRGIQGTLASRVVEYALDESEMEATLVWEFPGDFPGLDPWYTEAWFTIIWGDADRLANGNTLITAGTRSPDQQSRIFEVTPDGKVVWELIFPLRNDAGIGVYRAERITPPLVERL
jgi:hypothetical protein